MAGTVILQKTDDGGVTPTDLADKPFEIAIPSGATAWAGVVETSVMDTELYEHTLGGEPYAWYRAQIKLTTSGATVTPLGANNLRPRLLVQDTNPE